MYKFYVQMDGATYGPYSAKEILGLGLLDDTLVTEESLNGEWLPARRFDFQDMYLKESGTVINEDGSISRESMTSIAGGAQTSKAEQTHEGALPNADDMSKFNWGAFWFNWLWAACNGFFWPLFLVVINFIPYVGSVAYFGVCIYLGIKGNELAWKAKQWDSWESFKAVQKKWSNAVWWLLGICLAIIVLAGIIESM